VVDGSYRNGDLFALIADPSWFEIAFDDIKILMKSLKEY